MSFKAFKNLFGSKTSPPQASAPKPKVKRSENYEGRNENNDLPVKALYIMAFTPEKLNPKTLPGVTHLAADMLKAKAPFFKQLMERMAPQAPIEIANLQFVAMFYTPETMQTSMKGWVEKRYNVAFKPVTGRNFFLHGMRDPQGRENYVLFYFDIGGPV